MPQALFGRTLAAVDITSTVAGSRASPRGMPGDGKNGGLNSKNKEVKNRWFYDIPRMFFPEGFRLSWMAVVIMGFHRDLVQI